MENDSQGGGLKTSGFAKFEELCSRVRCWNRNLSPEDHVVRSCILELHASVEAVLKHILFQHILFLIEPDQLYHGQNGPHVQALANAVKRCSFSQLQQLVEPCLNAWLTPICVAAPKPPISRGGVGA